MNLKDANKELEKLENDERYYLREKEQLLSLVMPIATDIRPEKVDGGKRVDRLLKYVETEEEKQINATLDYIYKRKQNLIGWIEQELKILKKYNDLEKLIIYYKEECPKKYTWYQISAIVGYSVTQCRRIYRKYKKKRNI